MTDEDREIYLVQIPSNFVVKVFARKVEAFSILKIFTTSNLSSKYLRCF